MKKTKVFSLLLACLMILSVFPMTIFADEAPTGCPGHGKTHSKANCTQYSQIEVVDPICGEWGYTLYQCSVCKDYFADDFVPGDGSDHDWKVIEEAVPAVCVNPGKTEKKQCQTCGKIVGGEVIPAPFQDHDWQIESQDGDCETEGTIVYYCTRCDEHKTETTGGVGHKWGTLPKEIKKAPKWNENGIAVYECEVCHKTKEVEIWGEHDHQLIEHKRQDPTCTAPGMVEYWECSICKKNFTDNTATKEIEGDLVIKALGHDLENAEVLETYPAVCDNAGWKDLKCNRCGETVREEIEAPGHSYDKEPTKILPTCDSWGFDVYACTVCGHVERVNPQKPLGHTAYNDEASKDKKETPADCVTPGSRTWKCGRCDKEMSETLAAHGHNEVTVTVKPTCSVFGYTFTYCTNEDCPLEEKTEYEKDGKQYNVTVDGKGVHLISCEVGSTLDPNAHDFASGTVNEATCEEDGNAVGFCPNCNEYYQIVLPALGHDYDASIEDNVTVKVPQSCTDDEVIEVKCSRCDSKQEQKTDKKATGHNFDEGTVIPPTCQKDGCTRYTCQNGCGTTKEEDTTHIHDITYEYASLDEAKADHPGIDESSVTEFRKGNCQIIGLYRYHCDDCGKNVLVVIDNTGKGHVDPGTYGDEGDKAGQAPTCTDAGWTAAYHCSVCGEFVESTPLAATGHTWNKTPEKKATCTAPGTKERWQCDVCEAIDPAHDGGVIEQLAHQWVDYAEVAPTCKDAGTSAYKECSVCHTQEGKTTLPALNHKNMTVVDSREMDCETYGYKHHVCPDCGYEYIDKYVEGREHSYKESGSTPATCDKDGNKHEVCEHNPAHTKDTPIPAIGHQNKEGQTLKDDCQDEPTDRTCVNCNKEIGKSHHDMFEAHINATCVDYGYDILVCRNCGYSTVTNVNEDELGEHNWGDGDGWVVTEEPTFTHGGKKERDCTVCGRHEEEDLDPKVGLEFSMEVDNAVVSGAKFSDSSLLAVKVSFDSSKIEAWGIRFDLTYDVNALEFVRAEFTGDKFTTLPTAHDNDGYVSVLANVPNDEEGKTQNVTIEGKDEFVVLYFRVNTGRKTEDVVTTLSFSKTEVVSNDAATIASAGVSTEITIVPFLDYNHDFDVTMVDALYLYQIISGELENQYDTTIDVNKDGEITLGDLMDLYAFMSGEKTYEDMVKTGV